ncbi:MAG: peptidoglycan-associated lipoprotein Pal [Hyphomicrobiales bacterium]|nr:peptidoglycan-associated lipoprotein Pal [Hyphomicrobiales bacterium]
MQTRTASRLAVLAILILVAGCSQKSPEGAGFGLGGADGPVTPGSAREFTVKVGDTVYFDTDSVSLSPDAQQTLAAQARWLRQYPNYSITIEGHADERGTREYNIGLGAQRATAAKQFLASQGVNPGRVQTLSYGKERPVAVCDNISCWSQNRRAVTVLNSRGGPVASY